MSKEHNNRQNFNIFHFAACQIDLQERINSANKTYVILQKFFRNKNVSKKLKLCLKNTIIDKTLTYAL